MLLDPGLNLTLRPMKYPVFFEMYKNAIKNTMKNAVLNYCGVSPVKVTTFAPIKSSTPEKRTRWLSEIELLGEKINIKFKGALREYQQTIMEKINPQGNSYPSPSPYP